MENNKLLAEYLERKVFRDHLNLKSDPIYHVQEKDKRFIIWNPDKDWNQLMTVVEKIEEELEVKDVQIFKTTCNICDEVDNIIHTDLPMPRIKATYNACVEYIKSKQ